MHLASLSSLLPLLPAQALKLSLKSPQRRSSQIRDAELSLSLHFTVLPKCSRLALDIIILTSERDKPKSETPKG